MVHSLNEADRVRRRSDGLANGGAEWTHLAKDERVEEGGHVDGRGLGVLGETVQNVENVLADVVSTVDGYGIGDDGSFVPRERRVGQRADEKPGEEPDVVNALDKLLRSGQIDISG